MTSPSLPLEALKTLFPFLFVVDESLHVVSAGPSLEAVYPCEGQLAAQRFSIKRPVALEWSWQALKASLGRLVVFECEGCFALHMTPCLLESPRPMIAMCGAPWLERAEDIMRLGLTIKQFAPQDHIVNYIFLMQRLTVEAQRRQEAAQRDERAQAELRQLKLINDERERLSSLKDEFLAGVSHELRTPLTGILGAAEGIQEEAFGPVPEEMSYPVEVIIHSAEHLLGIVNDLLDLSKYSAEDVHIDPVMVQLDALVHEVISMIEPQLERRGLELRLELESPLMVECDQRATRQMLLNLIGNAIKYTAEGFVRVSLISEAQAVLIHVEDSGCGISSEAMEEIFEPFRRGDALARRLHDGAGLGLPIARRMARRHGGDITVRSELGQGSRFTLRLPLRQPQAD